MFTDRVWPYCMSYIKTNCHQVPGLQMDHRVLHSLIVLIEGVHALYRTTLTVLIFHTGNKLLSNKILNFTNARILNDHKREPFLSEL